MRAQCALAPPVGVTCSGAGAWRWVRALLVALTAAVFSAGLLLWPHATPLVALGTGLGMACVAAVLSAYATRPHPASLNWDGERWVCGGAPGEVDLMLDLGPWLLLRLRPADAAARWLPMPAAEAGPAWHGLRAALYSPAALHTPPASRSLERQHD